MHSWSVGASAAFVVVGYQIWLAPHGPVWLLWLLINSRNSHKIADFVLNIAWTLYWRYDYIGASQDSTRGSTSIRRRRDQKDRPIIVMAIL